MHPRRTSLIPTKGLREGENGRRKGATGGGTKDETLERPSKSFRTRESARTRKRTRPADEMRFSLFITAKSRSRGSLFSRLEPENRRVLIFTNMELTRVTLSKREICNYLGDSRRTSAFTEHRHCCRTTNYRKTNNCHCIWTRARFGISSLFLRFGRNVRSYVHEIIIIRIRLVSPRITNALRGLNLRIPLVLCSLLGED